MGGQARLFGQQADRPPRQGHRVRLRQPLQRHPGDLEGRRQHGPHADLHLRHLRPVAHRGLGPGGRLHLPVRQPGPDHVDRRRDQWAHAHGHARPAVRQEQQPHLALGDSRRNGRFRHVVLLRHPEQHDADLSRRADGRERRGVQTRRLHLRQPGAAEHAGPQSHLVARLPVRHWSAPVFCTRGYESTVWVTGKGLNPGVRLCC